MDESVRHTKIYYSMKFIDLEKKLFFIDIKINLKIF